MGSVTRPLAMMLFQDYVFPFELTSILILIAILGAIVLARREDGQQ
jgi:NADH-quinone oxidoreductase subunit J